MYKTKKTYVEPDMIMAELILENPALLLMMEHFELDFVVRNINVAQICIENKIGIEIFTSICNLYNGFIPSGKGNYRVNDILSIIRFLKNSHTFYQEDKYPEIQSFIQQLNKKNNSDEVILIKKFFNEYFAEVTEHLKYEDEIAFPYFCELVKQGDGKPGTGKRKFSANEYREHHSDIESKLADLKNLLLKHIVLKNDLTLRRKLLCSLFELEFDLNIHSLVEEMILIPLVENIEKNITHE